MALRLAGEEFSVVQGLDAQGWVEETQASIFKAKAIQCDGHISFKTDNTYDIGSASAIVANGFVRNLKSLFTAQFNSYRITEGDSYSGLRIERNADDLLMGLELANIYLTHTGAMAPYTSNDGEYFRLRVYDGDDTLRDALRATNGTGAGNPGLIDLGSVGTRIRVLGDIDFIPAVDNQTNIGTAGNRFKLVRAVTITSGDLGFEESKDAVSGENFAPGDILALIVMAVDVSTAETVIGYNPDTGEPVKKVETAYNTRCVPVKLATALQLAGYKFAGQLVTAKRGGVA